MSPIEIVLEFIIAINSKNLDKIVGLLTPDHCFTDSLGTAIAGRRHVRDAWQSYFTIMPDYRIDVAETYTDGNRVVVLGTCGGIFAKDGALLPEYEWHIPAAWRGQVDDRRLSAWQAYVDHEPLRRAQRLTEEIGASAY